jgi:hypothetical protein
MFLIKLKINHMLIQTIAQFKEICPTPAFDAFMESAREGDPDFLLDTFGMLNYGYWDGNLKNPIWKEFHVAMMNKIAYSGLQFDLENNLTNEWMAITKGEPLP